MNEAKIESAIENWFSEVGRNIGLSGASYFKVLFTGIKEFFYVNTLKRSDKVKMVIHIAFTVVAIIFVQYKSVEITNFYSDYLKMLDKNLISKMLYKPLIIKVIAWLMIPSFFTSLGHKKLKMIEYMTDQFEEMKFFSGKKKTIIEDGKKIKVPKTPLFIRKIYQSEDTFLYIFTSDGILPEEWEKRKTQLEYMLDGHIINFNRGNKKSMTLVVVNDERFEILNEPYSKMELYDENFQKIGLVGSGSREVEVFGEIVKTKNFPQFIEEKEEEINGKQVLNTTFKSSGLTLEDFKEKKYAYENVMNRLLVSITQNKKNKQLYHYKTISTEDEIRELYHWSDDKLDEREAFLVLGEGRVEKETIDLNITPHVLFGGVTRSGKSVMMKCVIYQGIIKGWYPVLIDFKGGLELGAFSDYSDTGVIYEEKKVLAALKKITIEHHARIAEFAKLKGVKNIVEYNERVSEDKTIRRVMIVLDEIAEVLDTLGKSKAEVALISSIEKELNTLARLGAASGIHILAGTQRPDSKVLTGQIKSNLGARVCSRMTDIQPSIMVLGSPDAVKLPADIQGRFMYSIGSDVAILQGYYFKESDIKAGNYAKGKMLTIAPPDSGSDSESAESKNSKTNSEPYEDFEECNSNEQEEAESNDNSNDDGSEDEFLEDAIKFVIGLQSASVSVLQRKFRIGYNRAARMIDVMEERGIVGPSNGSEPREVFVQNEQKKEKTKTAEENYESDMAFLIKTLNDSDPVKLRPLKALGVDQETLLDLLVIIYEKKLVEGATYEQLKLLLFKEKRISTEEYGKHSNAEPFL